MKLPWLEAWATALAAIGFPVRVLVLSRAPGLKPPPKALPSRVRIGNSRWSGSLRILVRTDCCDPAAPSCI
ncbi:MAG: hypothetical protein PVG05_07545 [Gammaproteobacteria bacterium]